MPLGLTVGVVLLAEMLFVGLGYHFSDKVNALVDAGVSKTPDPNVVTNTEALGHLVYTQYFYLFQGAGLVLLVAMVGAIVLTHRQRDGVKRQNIGYQTSITAKDGFEIIKVKSGGGI
jgi:NADH-quinone oxidoreductase subunit J